MSTATATLSQGNSASTKSSDTELTKALLTVATNHDNHDETLYRKICRIEVAIVNGVISQSDLQAYGITCSVCLKTIEHDLNTDLKVAVKYFLSNYTKIDAKVFESISFIKKAQSEEKKDILHKEGITARCHEIILNHTEDLVLNQINLSLQRKLRSIGVEDRADLLVALNDQGLPTKTIEYLMSAVDHKFVSISDLISQ